MSAEGPRTPEEWARMVTDRIVRQDLRLPSQWDREIEHVVRAALAARDAEWREALLRFYACPYWLTAKGHSCPDCAALRALLSEGHDGK